MNSTLASLFSPLFCFQVSKALKKVMALFSLLRLGLRFAFNIAMTRKFDETGQVETMTGAKYDLQPKIVYDAWLYQRRPFIRFSNKVKKLINELSLVAKLNPFNGSTIFVVSTGVVDSMTFV